ncbi:hypothetical protein LJ737_22180 [Hymenobacter sp. 15J16-1T3B]|uniref:hypothetical protein n=1 Tax=Hymenobacter sp. 15J16-1T3B TaxID=2886941 RepID=UPI001D1204DE|nr:hypothetical protein [Hymenobacter sp. 15J16-1T3B]MCC3159962.1 hypothetical protein [Hymenobacter sp. 15J16-1T3B]
MKKYVAAAALLVGGLLTTAAAQAQTQPAPATPFTGGEKPRKEATTKKRKQPSAEELARMQQRMSMNPDEVKRDQQMEVLEARAGMSTSLGSANGSARQYDKSAGGFTVRKFRGDKRSAAMQKRGEARPAPGIDPPGKPLKHKKPKRHFLGL